MAFNIIAEATSVIDWDTVRREIFKSKYEYLNIFPIANRNGVNAIGISVPFTKLDEYCWEELNILIYQLLAEFSFKVYELYDGEEIHLETIDNLKRIIGFKI